jgi:hypothetical protein
MMASLFFGKQEHPAAVPTCLPTSNKELNINSLFQTAFDMTEFQFFHEPWNNKINYDFHCRYGQFVSVCLSCHRLPPS